MYFTYGMWMLPKIFLSNYISFPPFKALTIVPLCVCALKYIFSVIAEIC